MLTPALEETFNQVYQAFKRQDFNEVLGLLMPLMQSGHINEMLRALDGRTDPGDEAVLVPVLENIIADAYQAFKDKKIHRMIEIMMFMDEWGHLDKARAALDGRALFMTGLMRLCVPTKEGRAGGIEALTLAALVGNAYAQTLLGRLYNQGEGVPKDKVRARQLWEQAAEAGNAEAPFMLGFLYFSGEGGVAENKAKTVELWEQAAEAGNADAQFMLGRLYHTGEGIAENKERARELWEKAAAAGNSDAQSWLGLLYFTGEGGVKEDESKARELWEQAAEGGSEIAQQILKRFSQ